MKCDTCGRTLTPETVHFGGRNKDGVYKIGCGYDCDPLKSFLEKIANGK